jgi:hypothetical protein
VTANSVHNQMATSALAPVIILIDARAWRGRESKPEDTRSLRSRVAHEAGLRLRELGVGEHALLVQFAQPADLLGKR